MLAASLVLSLEAETRAQRNRGVKQLIIAFRGTHGFSDLSPPRIFKPPKDVQPPLEPHPSQVI